ncbi:MAG TPA: MGMT family protein [Bacteroidia bacterium]|nr:MGMT family protein [Bacteroidia bacterium]
MKKGNSFYERVYKVARMIPHGRVTSYGAIAKHLGSPQSARMVGWAMNNSFHANPPVPAHRVLNRNGMLTGKYHFGSPTMMRQLLENEGIRVVDDCVVDWEKVFWEPETIKRNRSKRKK